MAQLLKTTSIATFLSLSLSAAAAVGADGIDFPDVNVGGIDYQLSCEWEYAGDVGFMSSQNHDFFIEGDYVYVNSVKTSNYDFIKLDAKTGKNPQKIKIDWPGGASPASTLFVGKDYNGTVYVASGSLTKAVSSSNPFNLYSLSFTSDGTPSAVAVYGMTAPDNWYVRDVAVRGSIDSGDFHVLAAVWTTPGLAGDPQTLLASWKFTSGKASTPQYVKTDFTVAQLEAYGDDMLMIYSRGDFYNRQSKGYLQPTLLKWNPDVNPDILTVADEFEGPVISKCCNTFEVFSLSGTPHMAYWSGVGECEDDDWSSFAIAQSPSMPDSFDGSSMVYNEFGLGSKTIRSYNTLDWPWYKTSAVHTQQISANQVRIVVFNACRTMSSYILTAGGAVTPPEPPVVQKEAPVFDPVSGTELKKGDKVTITCESAIAVMYKMNGATAEIYSAPITVESDCTIEAYGIYADGQGPAATATYTIEKPLPPKVAPVFNPASGSVLKKGDKVTITCENAKAIMYKLNGSEAEIYSAPLTIESDCTIEAYGIYADGYGPTTKATYTIEKPLPPKVAPVFNPASGSELKKGDKVTITCENAIVIMYCIDGGTIYQYPSDGIAIEKDCTVEAYGLFADGEGPHAQATYKVEVPKTYCFLPIASENDITTGALMAFAGISDGEYYVANSSQDNLVAAQYFGSDTDCLKIPADSGTGVFSIEPSNKGGYMIYDNVVRKYLKAGDDYHMYNSDSSEATRFSIEFASREGRIYAEMIAEDGRTFTFNPLSNGFGCFAGMESNVVICRYIDEALINQPDELYLHTNILQGWNFAEPVGMAHVDGTVIRMDNVNIPVGASGEFIFSTAKAEKDGRNDDWLSVAQGVVYSPLADVNEVETGALVALKAWPERYFYGSTPPTFKVDGNVNYSFSIDFGGFSPVLKVEKAPATPTGFDEVIYVESDAEYYNLQGFRVENPAAGLYIVRKGASVSKVYIK